MISIWKLKIECDAKGCKEYLIILLGEEAQVIRRNEWVVVGERAAGWVAVGSEQQHFCKTCAQMLIGRALDMG